jgi:hypothetical protein
MTETPETTVESVLFDLPHAKPSPNNFSNAFVLGADTKPRRRCSRATTSAAAQWRQPLMITVDYLTRLKTLTMLSGARGRRGLLLPEQRQQRRRQQSRHPDVILRGRFQRDVNGRRRLHSADVHNARRLRLLHHCAGRCLGLHPERQPGDERAGGLPSVR